MIKKIITVIAMMLVLTGCYAHTLLKYQDKDSGLWWTASIKEEKEVIQLYNPIPVKRKDGSDKMVSEHGGFSHVELKPFASYQRRAKLQTDNKQVVEWLLND